MVAEHSRRSLAAWGVAGLPLVATLVQTLMALFGYTSESAGIEPVTGPLLSVPVLFEAAVVFKQSSAVVLGLFLLIALAWAGQGIGMFVLESREAAYGAASLGGVLFFVLFFGVYAPLFGAEAGVPLAQLVLFSLVPVIASAAMLYGAYRYPWERTVERRANADLGEVESELSRIESRFDDGFDRRFPDESLTTLAATAPRAVEDAREDRADFDSDVREIRDRIEECRSLPPERRHRAVTEIETRVGSLSADERLDTIESDLCDRLASRLEAEYGTITITSPLGEPYELVNLPTQYREIDLPGASGPVHVDRLGETLAELARESSLGTVAEAVESADRAIERTERYVDDRASETLSAIETAEDNCSTVESQVRDRRLTITDRLEAIVIDGRTEAVAGVSDVRDDLQRARDRLHACDFDDAARIAREAADTSDQLVLIAEFAGVVSSAADGGRQSVSVPADLPTGVGDALANAAERAHQGVTVTVRDGTLQFDHPTTTDRDTDDADEPEQTGGGSVAEQTTQTTERETVAPMESVVDEVLYVLGEFVEKASPEETVLQYSLSELPESMATRDVLINVRRFAQRQSDLLEDVTLQSPEPPGFVEFTANDTDIDRALEQTRERFRERYT